MEKLQASVILEILGRPKEHVTEALTTLIVKMGAEKGVNILNKHLHDPIPIKDSKDLFTTFAEIELELDSISTYIKVIFVYLPSNIEIIHPEKINLSNVDLNEIGNLLTQRMHNYDAVTKKMIIERDIIAKKLCEVAPEVFKQLQQPPQQVQEKPKKEKKTKTKKKPSKKKSG